ncbi:hypothetical protein XENORESO_019916 [Xenotaenia resolanae]|uniref:Uncharacterized protein n=1 Tax=Xenotaenia resolanae TaxID=208358 RepID=A0ABV0X1A0_9TELE
MPFTVKEKCPPTVLSDHPTVVNPNWSFGDSMNVWVVLQPSRGHVLFQVDLFSIPDFVDCFEVIFLGDLQITSPYNLPEADTPTAGGFNFGAAGSSSSCLHAVETSPVP